MNPTSDLDGDGITNENDTDIDGDGLSNNDEDLYGTSAYIKDTDGDGWTDYEEVERFVPAENKFNPAIADLPRIQLVLKSEPLVKMEYETSSGKSVEYSTSTSESYEETHTSSNSFSHSFGTEHGWSVELGFEFGTTGAEPHYLGHINVGAHGTYTTEDSYEWGTEESYTNARSVESAKSISSSEDLTKIGGSMTYSVAFKNTGPMAYSVDTMELSAYKIDRNDPQLIGSISQSSNSSFSEFQSFILNPGQESGIFSFRNDSLYVSDVMSLLGNSSGIICAVAGYSISMEGVDFTQSGTDVPVKTAKIFIDYGPGVDNVSEQYSVATKTNINTSATTLFELYNPVLLKDIFASINIPYDLGDASSDEDDEEENPDIGDTNNGLISVRDVAMDPEFQKYWYVSHIYKENNTDMIAVYAAHKCNYDFDKIEIKTGDTVQLIYSIDGDDDGIPLRIEKMLGTSDELLDSDGDTLSDWDELHPDPETNPKTNPANKDTDGDGLLDNEDSDPLVAIISNDAVLVNIELSVGTINFVKDSTEGSGTKVREYTITDVVADAIQITPYAAKNACPITITLNDSLPIDAESDRVSEELPLLVGDNTILITVTALDGVTEETYTLNINSKLSPVTGLTATPAGETDNQLSWSVPDDDRISGMIIRSFARSGSTVLDTATPENRYYDVGDTIGNGTVVYVLTSESVEQRDSDLLNATTYDYEIFTYNKIGSSYTWSNGIRATSSTIARTQARLHFELYYLKAIKDEDGGSPSSEYYWDIKLNSVGKDTVIIDSKLDSHASLNADNDEKQYYSFTSNAVVPYEPLTYRGNYIDVDRFYGKEVIFNLNIYEHDENNYDRGNGDDDVICANSYYFTYNFDDDIWNSTISDFLIGESGEHNAKTKRLSIDSDHGDCEIRIRFWWEEL